MNRRIFSKRLGIGLAALGAGCGMSAREEPVDKEVTALVKPERLRQGDTVGLITPASYIPDRDLAKAMNNLKQLGFKVKQGRYLRAKRGYNAGTDEQRLDDLHRMFADSEVKAVWCARGGYGCTRLLYDMDYELIRQNPKIIIGYSDITALLQAIHRKTGLVTFHGPVGFSTLTPYTIERFQRVLMKPESGYTLYPSQEGRKASDPIYQLKTVKGGTARGPLAGGNLSLLAALAGTEFELDARGKVVFFEDVEEKPYSVDRMYTQLLQTAYLKEAAGFALGIFNDCIPEPQDESLTLLETINDRLGVLGKPTVYGLSFGHVRENATLPVGLPVELDADRKTIVFLESAVV